MTHFLIDEKYFYSKSLIVFTNSFTYPHTVPTLYFPLVRAKIRRKSLLFSIVTCTDRAPVYLIKNDLVSLLPDRRMLWQKFLPMTPMTCAGFLLTPELIPFPLTDDLSLAHLTCMLFPGPRGWRDQCPGPRGWRCRRPAPVAEQTHDAAD